MTSAGSSTRWPGDPRDTLWAGTADRLAVMYAGRFVEYAPAEQVATAPAHPYTKGLLGSFPDMRGARRELHGIPGTPPDLREDFAGCPFAPRCAHAFDPCATEAPGLRELPGRNGWLAACHLQDPAYGAPGFPSLEMTR